jgi:DNA-binding response OmpR family regulator
MFPVHRILVCDDDELLRELLQFRLEAKGFDVVVAGDGREALASIQTAHPDAVVLDAMMPGMDGFEVLRRLREEDGTRDIPVIMLTARKGERDIVDALRLGASDYLSKPFIPDELSARLVRLLTADRS